MEDFNIKIILATFGGYVVSWFGTVWQLALFTFISMLLDYVTGILAGRANEGLNSKKAVLGLYKKIGTLVLLCLGFLLDGAFNHIIAQGFSFVMPFALPIGLVVAMWICITEAISVCENLERIGVSIPRWLLELLHKTQDDIDVDNE